MQIVDSIDKLNWRLQDRKPNIVAGTYHFKRLLDERNIDYINPDAVLTAKNKIHTIELIASKLRILQKELDKQKFEPELKAILLADFVRNSFKYLATLFLQDQVLNDDENDLNLFNFFSETKWVNENYSFPKNAINSISLLK